MTSRPDTMADVQAQSDARRLKIDAVGIKDLRHPIRFKDRGEQSQTTVALLNLNVGLAAEHRGTHMSRFIELLNDHHAAGEDLSLASFRGMLRDMAERLNANSGVIEITFPFFINKHAPVTGVAGLIDYTVKLRGVIDNDATKKAGKKPKIITHIEVTVPVTSLCPCSKEIADYGAHNQRSHVHLNVRSEGILWVEELIEIAESQASAQLYAVLKRADEKFVTEQAYDNPKFVEDLVRDIAGKLLEDARVDAFTVEVENFESIHNHSAFARIVHDKANDEHD